MLYEDRSRKATLKTKSKGETEDEGTNSALQPQTRTSQALTPPGVRPATVHVLLLPTLAHKIQVHLEQAVPVSEAANGLASLHTTSKLS